MTPGNASPNRRFLYLDTNVYNFIADTFREDEIARLRQAGRRLGRLVALSPVNIAEFVASPDEGRTDRLIWVAQNLAEAPLLIEIESLLVHEIALALGLSALKPLLRKSAVSNSDLSRSWEEVTLDRRKTLQAVAPGKEWMQAVRSMYSTLHGLLSRNLLDDEQAQSLLAPPGGGNVTITDIATQLWKAGASFRRRPLSSPDHSISQAMVQSIILIGGMTPYFGPIDDMWTLLNIGTSEEKISFIKEHQDKYLNRGTMLMLTEAMTWAATQKFSHGSWLDAYHICYAQIVQGVLTLDSGILEFRNSWPEGRARDRIGHAGPYIEALRRMSRTIRRRRST